MMIALCIFTLVYFWLKPSKKSKPSVMGATPKFKPLKAAPSKAEQDAAKAKSDKAWDNI